MPNSKRTEEPTEEPTVSITSHYERKISDGDYGSIVASVFITEKFSGTVDAQALAEQAQSQFQVIKAEVLTQLGRPFEMDEATGMVIETFPGTTVVAQKTAPAPRRQATRSAAVSAAPEPEEEPYYEEDATEEQAPEPAPRRPAPARRAAAPTRPAPARSSGNDEDPDGYWGDLMDNPGDWSMPEKRSERSPDFQHLTRKKPGTNYKVGLWSTNAPSWFVNPFAGRR
jgi:hypothetical protein